MEGSEIRREDSGAKGRYALTMPDGQEAYLTYLRSGGDHLLVDYTFVPPPYRGRGVAERLVRHLVDEARAQRAKITPLCGYVAAEFRRHKDWADVLKRGS
jgi:predicted GNAT family acetyltransferase